MFRQTDRGEIICQSFTPFFNFPIVHCFTKFWDECIEPTDCLAYFRDLKTGKTNHEKGQFYIPIVEVFIKAGVSDLAVVMLKHPVEEHPDYKLGIPLQPIRLAAENPKPGDEVLTGGWGLTGQGLIKARKTRSAGIGGLDPSIAKDLIDRD